MVSFTHAEAKHSWTTLRMSRPLFVGSYLQLGHVVDFRLMKRTNRMIITLRIYSIKRRRKKHKRVIQPSKDIRV